MTKFAALLVASALGSSVAAASPVSWKYEVTGVSGQQPRVGETTVDGATTRLPLANGWSCEFEKPESIHGSGVAGTIERRLLRCQADGKAVATAVECSDLFDKSRKQRTNLHLETDKGTSVVDFWCE